MGTIYEGTEVTIIAAVGADANYGLSGIGSRTKIARPSITINSTTWVYGLRDTKASIYNNTWAKRGWVNVFASDLRDALTLSAQKCTRRGILPADDCSLPMNKCFSSATLASEMRPCTLPWVRAEIFI